MKKDNWDYTFILLLCLSFLILLTINNVGLNNKLKECKQSDTFYQEYSAFYVKQSEKCESELNDIKEDAAFLMNQFDKMAVMCDKEVLLLKDRCPICPLGEECIKLVKENKFQCINRELIGGN